MQQKSVCANSEEKYTAFGACTDRNRIFHMTRLQNSDANRAWVIGSSVAGVLAAGALAKHFKEVVVIDRDVSVGVSDPRKGAPQGQHVHALLPRGVAAAESIFPGIFDEIIEGGAVNGDLCGDAQWCPGGHRLQRSNSNMRVIAGSRPFIESCLFKRMKDLPNVHLITDLVGTGFETDGQEITGIRLRDRAGKETVEPADVLVDAAGRGSQLPKWLQEHGLKEVPEERLNVKVGYASTRFKLSTARNVDLYALIIGASPDVPRGGIAQTVENDILQVSMAAYAESPPTKLEDFLEYSKSLPQKDLHRWMQGAEQVGEITTHRVPTVYRRSFHKMRGLPNGLIAVGDSVCAFNPVFAQGMTVAAVEAEMLDRCLSAGVKKLTRRYFNSIRSVTKTTWQMGCTTDLSIPIVEGNLDFPSRMIARWISRVQRAATTNSQIAEKFIRVAALLDSPMSLMSPAFVLRVLGSRAAAEPPRLRVSEIRKVAS